MNRQQMGIHVRAAAGERMGTAGGGSPFGVNQALSDEADALAMATFCYHGPFSVDIVSGQMEYCFPPLFRTTAVYAVMGDGTTKLLREMKPEDLDAAERVLGTCLPPNWRSAPETGDPRLFLPESLSSIKLYPVPDYDAAVDPTTEIGGLTIEGYAVPGTGATGWDDPTDECPLPQYAHRAVILGAAIRRIMEFTTPEGMAKMPLLQKEYREKRGSLERAAASFSAGDRNRRRR